MTPFNGGEGIWHDGGVLYFTTKGDKRLWAYDSRTGTLEIVFDHAAAPDSSLDAVDNVTVSAAGEIFVCEDGGNMEIGLITPEREVSPFLRFTGPAHPVEGEFKSEVCGVVFDPSGTRMYCTSQRAHPQSPNAPGPGAVYEISGPFRQPLTPGAGSPFGLPAGERRSGPLRGGEGELRVKVRRRIGRRTLLRRGLVIEIRAPAGARVVAVLDTPDLLRSPGPDGTTERPRTVALARRRFRGLDRSLRRRLRLAPAARRRLRRSRRPLTARLLVTARLPNGRRLSVVRRIRVLELTRPLHGMSRFSVQVQGSSGRADSQLMSIEVTNGLPEGADQGVSIELTLAEAEAVKSWLLKPSADGSAAIDDENAKSVMVKLGAKLDYIQGVQRVRDELEQAGFPTEQLSDDDVADLGRRIAESPIRRYSGS